MKTQAPDTVPDPEIGQLLLDLARVHQWTAMYAPGHPFLRERVAALHGGLVGQAAKEPSGVLLLGIARDKVLHRDRFFEARHPIVLSFAEDLYRHHVATIGFGTEATPDGLAVFFRCLRELQSGKIEEIPDGHLQREGIRGVYISPVNYKEVLSREIVERGTFGDARVREEALWRALLADKGGKESSGDWVSAELLEFPEVLPAILRRAREAARGAVAFPRAGRAVSGVHPPGPGGPWSAGGNPSGGDPAEEGKVYEEAVSPEVLHAMLQRIGRTLKTLPEDRRMRVLESLGEGVADGGFFYGPEEEESSNDFHVSMARSLADGHTDAEFLELLAGLMSMEHKGGKRLLRAFQIIAEQRDVQGSLVPLLETWSREGHHAKDYYEGKTWEAVERLLLGRSEDAYLGEDHSRLLETLSDDKDRRKGKEPGPGIDAAFAPFLDPNALRRKTTMVLIDLLRQEWQGDADFEDLLAEAVQAIPALVEGKEFALLSLILDAIAAAGEKDSAGRREATAKALAAVDFRRITGACLSGPDAVKDSGEWMGLFVKHGARTVTPLLDRLLVEPDKGMRRVLLAMLVRIGEPAVPFVAERLKDLPWYFLRNLCYILGEIGAANTVPGLVRMLAHKDQRVRREAILALGKIRSPDPDAVYALGKILLSEPLFASGKEEPVRIDAASSLSRIGGAEALSYLHRGKSCRRTAVRDHCGALLRMRGRG